MSADFVPGHLKVTRLLCVCAFLLTLPAHSQSLPGDSSLRAAKARLDSSSIVDSLRKARPKYVGDVTVEYDRFKEQTTAFLRNVPTPIGMDLTMFSILGKPDGPQIVSLIMHGSYANWKYLNCHDLTILADGKRVRFIKESTHDGRVRDGGVSEFVEALMTGAEFTKMANAKLVEGKLCNDEFALETPHVLAFQELAARIKAKK